MTQNLNLYSSSDMKLTSSDSQVSSSGFTLKAQNTGTWCTTNSSACDDQSMSMYSDNSSYGTYYNWYTATAGSGTYSTSSGNASYSICPKGWRLPTGGSSGEWKTLYSNYNSLAKLQASPVSLVKAGYREGGSVKVQGSYGYNWSSTTSGAANAYIMRLEGTSGVSPAGAYYKYAGFNIRCVAK